MIWLALEWIFNSSEFLRVLAPLSKLANLIGVWLVSEWISKSFGFAGVSSAVEIGVHYWGLACIGMDF